MTPPREIRALYDDESVTVYQAYPVEIASAAVRAGRFAPPFGMNRMTWIKPSFLWMMYRSGWGRKPGQERVLAIRLSRNGFEDALSQAVASAFDPALHASPDDWKQAVARSGVRYQWDPERSLSLGRLEHRSLQLGLSGEAVKRYVNDWILGISDITGVCHELVALGPAAASHLPAERPYPVSDDLATTLGMT